MPNCSLFLFFFLFFTNNCRDARYKTTMTTTTVTSRQKHTGVGSDRGQGRAGGGGWGGGELNESRENILFNHFIRHDITRRLIKYVEPVFP